MLQSIGYAVRHENAAFKLGANVMLNVNHTTLFVTEKVGEWLYDGYDDLLVTFLRSTNSTLFQVPFEKFGWFVDRNNSWSYDGVFNMNTGESDMSKMGMLNEWNYESKTPFYSGGCSAINGTSGELWPPKIDPEGDLTLFVSDICRSVSLAPAASEQVERHGVVGSKWIGDSRVFDNGNTYEPNKCFCTSDPEECPDLLPGVYNVSDCRFGAPVFISYPHFYLGDPSYANAFDGLNPSKEKHEFSMALEANTGIPVEVNARMQINVLLQPISGLT